MLVVTLLAALALPSDAFGSFVYPRDGQVVHSCDMSLTIRLEFEKDVASTVRLLELHLNGRIGTQRAPARWFDAFEGVHRNSTGAVWASTHAPTAESVRGYFAEYTLKGMHAPDYGGNRLRVIAVSVRDGAERRDERSVDFDCHGGARFVLHAYPPVPPVPRRTGPAVQGRGACPRARVHARAFGMAKRSVRRDPAERAAAGA